MDNLRKRKTGGALAGILFLAILFWSQGSWAKIYSIQTGSFQNNQNARQHFILLKKTLPSGLSDHLRIEKKEKTYVVKVGKLDDLEQALSLLAALKPFAPDAFIWKGEYNKENLLKTEKNQITSAEQQPREDKTPSSGEMKKKEPHGKSETTPPFNQAMLKGTIREINSLNSERLGLLPGKKIYRLIIRVEESNKINEFPDFLKDKEGELLTVFSETNPPFFQPGNKITAVTEYRGDHFSRFYWIIESHPVKP